MPYTDNSLKSEPLQLENGHVQESRNYLFNTFILCILVYWFKFTARGVAEIIH